MRLLSVISFPKASANSAKFFAKASLTFHDLSSPVATSVPRVWTWFSSFVRYFAIGMKLSRQRTLIWSCSSWESCLYRGKISWIRCGFSSWVEKIYQISNFLSLHQSLKRKLFWSWECPRCRARQTSCEVFLFAGQLWNTRGRKARKTTLSQ